MAARLDRYRINTLHAVQILPPNTSNPAEILKHQFSKSLGMPWSDILPPSRLAAILEEEAIAYRSNGRLG